MSRIKDGTYAVLQSWMLKELNLKGNDLIIYAIITGFSQDGESSFNGSLQYLADWTNSTKQGVIKSLKNLLDRQLISKKETYKNNIKFVEYYTTKFNTPMQQSLTGGMQQSLTNNITINNKDNNKEKNIKKENLSLSENPQEVLNRIIERESKKEIREGLNNIFIDLIEKNSLKANDFTELNKTKEDLSKFITFLKESILNLNAQDLENLYNYLVIRKQKHKKLSNTIRTIKATLSNANELKQQKPWINGYYILIKQVSGYAGILKPEDAKDVESDIKNGNLNYLKVWQEVHLDYYKNELKKI